PFAEVSTDLDLAAGEHRELPIQLRPGTPCDLEIFSDDPLQFEQRHDIAFRSLTDGEAFVFADAWIRTRELDGAAGLAPVLPYGRWSIEGRGGGRHGSCVVDVDRVQKPWPTRIHLMRDGSPGVK